MIKETGLFIVIAIQWFSVYAEEFTTKIFSNDSLICIESSGEVGTGTIHASNSIMLVRDYDDLGKFQTIFRSDDNKPYLPIFTELQLMGKTSDESVLAFALGWNSFGGGYETYTGWLIRFDKTPSIIDWFEITLPRSFPGIAYDPKAGEIAVLVDKQKLEVINRDRKSYYIALSGDKKADLINTGTNAGLSDRNRKKWVLYSNHPFGTMKNDITVDSLFCVNKIKVSKTGFITMSKKY